MAAQKLKTVYWRKFDVQCPVNKLNNRNQCQFVILALSVKIVS